MGKDLSKMTLEELWELFPIFLVAHDDRWKDSFNTFSIYRVLPQIIELWGLNVQTDVTAKKNFAQLTAR